MSKHEPLRTILNDEFRVELQPVENGPILTVHGHASDPGNLTLIVQGVDGGDNETREVARIGVSLKNLFELAEHIKKAIGQ